LASFNSKELRAAMDLNLNGKLALVTGSTAGIGFAIARTFAQLGARVAINGRSAQSVEKAIEKLKAEVKEGEFVAAAADVSTKEGCDALFEALPEVDILVNNTGIFEPKDFFDIPDEDWERLFNVNVMSGVRLSRFYTPKMVEKKWGRVIFISSEASIAVTVEMIHYAMTKTAQLSVSRGLAEVVAGTGVTVNTVLPGPTLTEGVEDFLKKLPSAKEDASIDDLGREFMAKERPASLIKRLASPQEIANMVAYIASPAASATTGATLKCEGGLIRSIY
jgi:NAD(P)-dependent dehydrogenase (short-subunit alcohol dehydrogenase family)